MSAESETRIQHADTLGTVQGTTIAAEQRIALWPGLCVAAAVGLVYLTIASQGTFRFRPSMFPYHVYVADAWLHGQLNIRTEVLDARNEQFLARYRTEVEQQLAAHGQQLNDAQWETLRPRVRPATMHDLSYVNGKWYGYWPPMVSALLLPYVAIAGVGASDMLFSCIVGAATVFLTFLMLREASGVGLAPMTTATCVALAALLGLGTVHFYLAATGQVWFLSQVVATCFVTLAICCVLRSRYARGWAAAAGAAFGGAYLSRNTVLFLAPFFYCALFALWQRQGTRRWSALFADAVCFSMPLLAAGLVSLVFNYLRFGTVFDSGATAQILTGGNPRFRQDFEQYGLFSPHYLWRNVYYYFLNPLLREHPRTHAITFDPWGNSVFLVTPALLYVFRSGYRVNWFTVGAWTACGASLVTLVLYIANGWYQFGNRYLLDLMPLAILLVAIGMRGRLTGVSITLIGLSIAVNTWGTYRFCSEQF